MRMTRMTLAALALLALTARAQAQMGGPANPATGAATAAPGTGLWASLWRNADQRGDALLRQGNASAAAKEYSDGRRKAYAELKAGNFEAAAHDLAPYKDSDAEYNRGNALAHGGDLQGALAAYDAALKADPNNKDAKKNRDLVAAQLKKNPPPKPDDKKDNKESKPDGKKDGKQDDKKDSKGADKKDGKPDDKKDGKQDAKPGDQSGKPEDKKDGKPDQQQGKDGQPQQQPGQQPPAKPTDAKSDAEQARKEQADAMKGIKPGQPASADPAGKQQAPAAPPPTEKQIAQEQWLRSIPDDPGGLLRRKFLIEHMIRQRSAQP